MNKLLGIIIFIAGLGIGFWVGSLKNTTVPMISSTHSTEPSKQRGSCPTKAPLEGKWQSFGERVAMMDSDEQEAVLEALEPQEWAAAIESLLTQAGPNGLDSNVKEMVMKILTKRGVEDFDGAWEWSRSCKPEAMKIFAAKILLESLAEREPQKALKLYYEVRAISPKYESDVPPILLLASAAKGTDEWIQLLGEFHFDCYSTTHSGTHRGMPVEFAADFDFARAADAATRLIQDRETRCPEMFPDNFIEEWGKKDLQAAGKWMLQNPELPFNDWSGLYHAAQEILGAEEAGAWILTKLESAGNRKNEMMAMLINFSSSELIQSIAKAIPETQTRDQFLDDLIVASGGNYGENGTSTALELLSSPAARLEAIRKMPSHNDWEPDERELTQLGITRKQFDEVVTEKENDKE